MSRPMGVIWDVDGTLVDTAALHFDAWVRMSREMGRAFTPEDFSATFGRRNPEIIEFLFKRPFTAAEIQEIGDRKEGYYRAEAEKGIALLPGVQAMLEGLHALGVPQASLDSFAPEFREGMAARATLLGDVGESGPEHWEKPLGSSEVHVALAALSPDAARLQKVVERARRAHEELAGVEVVWQQDCYQLPSGRTSFGFDGGLPLPSTEGWPIPSLKPKDVRPVGS